MSKKWIILALAASLASVACVRTGEEPDVSEGVREGSQRAGEMAQEAGERVGEAARDTTERVGDAARAVGDQVGEVAIGAAVKAAIVANPILNDRKNNIDVDTEGDHVYLRGRVIEESMKSRAETLAKEVIKDNKSEAMLHNELKVGPDPD